MKKPSHNARPSGRFFTGNQSGDTGRRILLSGSDDARAGTHRLLTEVTGEVSESSSTWVTITRAGTYYDPRYGEFDITRPQLAEMVRNHDAKVLGQDVMLDVEHDRMNNPGSPGTIRKLSLDGDKLRGKVEWTEFGVEMVNKRGLRYLSADYHEKFRSNESPYPEHGVVLMGAALTTRPVIKNLDSIDRIQLSESCLPKKEKLAIAPAMRKRLSEQRDKTHMKWLEALKKKLSALGLSEAHVKQLCDQAKIEADKLGDDENALKALAAGFEAAGKQLAEQKPAEGQAIQLSVNIPKAEPKKDDINVDDLVQKRLSEALQKRDEDERKANEQLASKRKVFSDAITASDLGDDNKKVLSELATDLITPDMADNTIKSLAAREIEHAKKAEDRVAVDRQLASMGYQVQGSPRIEMDDTNQVKKLSQEITDSLRKTSAFATGQIKAPEEKDMKPYMVKALAEFDQRNVAKLIRERKVLAGEVSMDSSELPYSVQRQTLIEALHDLAVLDLANTNVDPTQAETHQIPYETRGTANFINDGVVFERGAIPNAGVTQELDSAQINAVKLAFDISDEVIHFSQNSQINWDAQARTIASNSRLVREITARSVANEWIRSSDAFSSTDVSNEDQSARMDGTNTFMKTAQFPIVRNKQVKNLQGNNVGTELNPITVRINGATIPQYDGTGDQTPGTYWTPQNLNLGYISIVDEAGALLTPMHTAGATDISYSYSTNVAKFDLDLPSGVLEDEHLNGLLKAIGARKAELADGRFVVPDMQMMSFTLENEVTAAKGFVPLTAQAGSALNPTTGEVTVVKGIPVFKTNAPNLDLGDQRIFIGQRGSLFYTIARTFQFGQLSDKRNSAGNLVGAKQAYGTLMRSIHVPEQWRGYNTSVIAYSVTDRNAA